VSEATFPRLHTSCLIKPKENFTFTFLEHFKNTDRIRFNVRSI
jgi:hypothetical protein